MNQQGIRSTNSIHPWSVLPARSVAPIAVAASRLRVSPMPRWASLASRDASRRKSGSNRRSGLSGRSSHGFATRISTWPPDTLAWMRISPSGVRVGNGVVEEVVEDDPEQGRVRRWRSPVLRANRASLSTRVRSATRWRRAPGIRASASAGSTGSMAAGAAWLADAGERGQAFHQLSEFDGGFLAGRQMGGIRGGVAGLGKREIGGRPQPGDGRAQLVGGVADEVAFALPDRARRGPAARSKFSARPVSSEGSASGISSAASSRCPARSSFAMVSSSMGRSVERIARSISRKPSPRVSSRAARQHPAEPFQRVVQRLGVAGDDEDVGQRFRVNDPAAFLHRHRLPPGGTKG